jgi:hypothetical protein
MLPALAGSTGVAMTGGGGSLLRSRHPGEATAASVTTITQTARARSTDTAPSLPEAIG